MRSIDLNVDLGETASPVPSAAELDLLGVASSVNLSCGLHAGNPSLLRHLLVAATERGVVAGAHPSYDDRAHFGRRETGLPAAAIGPLIARQLAFLIDLATAAGTRLRYVKAHGALYHRTAWHPDAAGAFAHAIHAVAPDLWILAPAASPLAAACAGLGIRFAAEAFLDRGYLADGHLVPRDQPGAFVHDPKQVAARAVALARGEPVAAHDGSPLRVAADSLCTHGDSTSALPVLRAARDALLRAGLAIHSFVP